MKLNLSRLVLTAGLGIGIISCASVAEAGIELNGLSLSGQSSKKPLPSQQKKEVVASKQSEKFTASVTPEIICDDKSSVQTEEEHTEKLLEAITGCSTGGSWGGNHNETMVISNH